MTDRLVELIESGAEPFVAPPADQTAQIQGVASSQAVGAYIVAGPLIFTGVPSSEAIGTPSVGNHVALSGLPSSEASGTPRIDMTVPLQGVPSSEAFGNLSTFASINPTGLPSSEAIGIAELVITINPAGLASSEVIGSHQLNLTVHLSGEASDETIGTLTCAGPVILTGLASSEVVGSHEVSPEIVLQLAGIPSSQALGAIDVRFVVNPPSIVGNSGSVIGTLTIGRIIEIQSVGSSEALGSPRIDFIIEPPGQPSDEVIGTIAIPFYVAPAGLPSSEVIGLHSLIFDQPIQLFGLPSTQEIGFHKVAVDGGRIAGGLENRRGPDTGGQLITLLAPGLDMASVEDKFATALDLMLWTPTTTGSGRVTVVPGFPRGTLQLTTNRGAASSALLRGNAATDRTDVTIDATVEPRFRNGTAVANLSMGIYVSATTFFKVIVERTRSTSALRIQGLENEATRMNIVVPVTPTTVFRLRILRDRERVYVFLNDSLVFQSVWTSVPGVIELTVENDALGRASMTMAVTKYTRNPVILFGGEPMKEVVFKSQDRLDGLTPPHSKGTVSIHVETATSEFDLNDEYEYLQSIDWRRVGLAGPTELVAVSDVAVRN